MSNNKRTLAALLVLALASTHATAEMSVRAFRQLAESSKPNDKLAMELYLSGLADGLQWSTTAATRAKQVPAYCMPPTLPLTVDTTKLLIQKSQLLQESMFDEMPVAAILVHELQNAFPCKR